MKQRRKNNSSVGKTIKGMLFFLLLPLILTSCEQVFTYSVFSWAQRDPSNLSKEQKVSYAQSVLGSGDQESMSEAYEAIKDNQDPEVQLLASELAIGASGLNEAVENAIEDLDSIDSGDNNIEDYLSTIDTDMLNNAVESMTAALEDPETAENVTPEQYVTVAAAVVISKVSDGTVSDLGDSEQVDYETSLNPDSYGDEGPQNNPDDWQEQTAFFIQESGYETDDLDSLLNLNN